jgi:hypothetical protein
VYSGTAASIEAGNGAGVALGVGVGFVSGGCAAVCGGDRTVSRSCVYARVDGESFVDCGFRNDRCFLVVLLRGFSTSF